MASSITLSGFPDRGASDVLDNLQPVHSRTTPYGGGKTCGRSLFRKSASALAGLATAGEINVAKTMTDPSRPSTVPRLQFKMYARNDDVSHVSDSQDGADSYHSDDSQTSDTG